MALLRHLGSGTQQSLRVRTWVGRHPDADLVLSAPGASSEHALIQWDGVCWVVSDRGSRNGTTLNDVGLAAHERRRLSENDVLVFGDRTESWSLVDAGMPRAWARRMRDGAVTGSRGDALFLPSEEAPLLGIYRQDGGWTRDGERGPRAVFDGEVLQVEDDNYRVYLPALDQVLVRTQAVAEAPHVARAKAHFEVSPDEELVRVYLSHGEVTRALPDWACNYVLLLLARAVLEDLAQGVAPAEVGFRYADDVARGLASSMTKLNVDVHRARRSVETLDTYRDPQAIVERRLMTGQLRLGTLQVSVETTSAK